MKRIAVALVSAGLALGAAPSHAQFTPKKAEDKSKAQPAPKKAAPRLGEKKGFVVNKGVQKKSGSVQ